jgi:hypothetical protein
MIRSTRPKIVRLQPDDPRSLLTKKRSNVPRVIVGASDPADDELFSHSWGRRAGLTGDGARLDDQAGELTLRWRPAGAAGAPG